MGKCKKRWLTLFVVWVLFASMIPVTPTLAAQPQRDAVESFVERLYSILLGRNVDTEGLQYWTDVLVSGADTGANVAASIVFSEELTNRNLSNEEFINCMYLTVFNREPDISGKDYWLSVMANGETRIGVGLNLLNSPEFGQICAQYGINQGVAVVPGSTPDSGSGGSTGTATTEMVQNFVKRLYSILLGREVDEAGLNYWTEVLVNQWDTGARVAGNIVFGEELQNRNLSNEEYVVCLYKTVFDREPEADGKAYWVSVLDGGEPRNNVGASLLNSEEFGGVCRRYNIMQGYIDIVPDTPGDTPVPTVTPSPTAAPTPSPTPIPVGKIKRFGTDRWASIIKQYVFGETGVTFSVLDVTGSEISVDTYHKHTHELLTTKSIPFELELFGGFYSGEEYNYIVFGQENMEEDDEKEVIRVVQYDKDFERIQAFAVTDCYTTIPFDAGSLRMAEKNGELVIHTARERYLTEDGLHHQSQLTIVIDTKTGSVTNSLGRFQQNHVSHSFNQFVLFDEDTHVLVDHGDAYPRSVVLNKYDGYYYSELDLFEIPGAVGANCTGVTVGGFEASEENYLVAINTIDHSKATNYTSFKIEGLERDERNIVLLVSDKNNKDPESVQQIYFTDYVGKKKCGSTPYLVKLSDNRFVLLWQEYEYADEKNTKLLSSSLKYVFLDGSGTALSEIKSDASMQLAKGCQPVVINNKIVWYVKETNNSKNIYSIDVEQ